VGRGGGEGEVGLANRAVPRSHKRQPAPLGIATHRASYTLKTLISATRVEKATPAAHVCAKAAANYLILDRISRYLGRTMTMRDHSHEHRLQHPIVIYAFASKCKRKSLDCSAQREQWRRVRQVHASTERSSSKARAAKRHRLRRSTAGRCRAGAQGGSKQPHYQRRRVEALGYPCRHLQICCRLDY
jgi:hypothetical protein